MHDPVVARFLDCETTGLIHLERGNILVFIAIGAKLTDETCLEEARSLRMAVIKTLPDRADVAHILPVCDARC